MALIYQSLGNFKAAIENFEKIALIYSKDKNSDEFKNTKESIKALEEGFKNHLDKFFEAGDPRVKDLKSILKKNKQTEEVSIEGIPINQI